MHTILGIALAWKVFKLIVPLYSTNAKVRICLEAIKCTKHYHLLLEYLGIYCLIPTLLHEDNTAVISF